MTGLEKIIDRIIDDAKEKARVILEAAQADCRTVAEKNAKEAEDIRSGIADKAERHVAELSDGERQKTMIAKALAQQTPIIILDEPTAFLDAAARIEIMQLLHRLATTGKAILLSTHDIDVALQLSDNLWLMNSNGLYCGTVSEIVESGKLDNLFTNSNLRFDPEAKRFVW